jgi:hypothetical protein
LIVHKVTDHEGNVLIENITLDMFFEKDLAPIEAEYEEKRLSYLQSLKSGESASQTPAATPAVQDGTPASEEEVVSGRSFEEKNSFDLLRGSRTS